MRFARLLSSIATCRAFTAPTGLAGSAPASVAIRRHRPVAFRVSSSHTATASKAGDDAASKCNDIVARLASLTAEHQCSPLDAIELHRRLETEAAIARNISAAYSDMQGMNSVTIAKMRVCDLQAELAARGLSHRGRKAELASRLASAMASEHRGFASDSAVDQATVPLQQCTGGGKGPPEVPTALREQLFHVEAKYAGRGPQTGIFTDGGCSPNPGPGGWGVVAVRNGVVLWVDRGRDKSTTNNRMELNAIIMALRRIKTNETAVIYSDSNLCVQTLTSWAPSWERNGWKRNGGQPVQNLDLVREALALSRERPGVRFEWLRGHAGSTWNEYADRLASFN